MEFKTSFEDVKYCMLRVSLFGLSLALSACINPDFKEEVLTSSPVNHSSNKTDSASSESSKVKMVSTVETLKPNSQVRSSHRHAELLKANKQDQIVALAKYIQRNLASHHYQAIVTYIHPTKGVRFSMYANVHKDTDKIFSQEQFTKYLQESRINFTWGSKDGTGDLYITALPDYLDNWVNNAKYDPNEAKYNEFLGSGNSLNNLNKAYPNTDFVEFYFPGTKQYDGIDWRALRLVFEEYHGQYYLVGVINDQWTV